MGTWATANLVILITILWTNSYAKHQLFGQPSADYGYHQQQIGHFHSPEETAHSTLSLYPQHSSTQSGTGFPAAKVSFENNQLFDKAVAFYETFENFRGNQNRTKTPMIKDRYDVGLSQPSASQYDNNKASQFTHIVGPQIETLASQHFHKIVPAFDIPDYHHQPGETRGETHYHQHKHFHKHEHKHEHAHQHKQNHQHRHIHNQQHTHQHNSQHGHQHKHDHHQQHKHSHQHGHKHQHQSNNKHQHNYKRDHKHGHSHGHKHHGHIY